MPDAWPAAYDGVPCQRRPTILKFWDVSLKELPGFLSLDGHRLGLRPQAQPASVPPHAPR